MAKADGEEGTAGTPAKPRSGGAAKPRAGTAAKPSTSTAAKSGTSTAAKSGTSTAAKPRTSAAAKQRSGAAKPRTHAGVKAAAGTAAEPGTGEGLPGRVGLRIHHLRPAPGARTAKTRVGRGEASKGKTAGRGTKGTKARGTVNPGFEGGQMPLQRRVPKLRGFSNLRFKTTYQVINTGRLAELYPQGGDVTPEDLITKGAVRAGSLVKVLGTGDADVTLRVTAHAFSASAREKITAAGGTVTEL
jgi:large subunit ribosomal protein L15